MNVNKINSCLDKSYRIFISNQNKYKYEKIKRQLNSFYKEGSKDKELAIAKRDEFISMLDYKYRGCSQNSISNFLSLISGFNCNNSSFFIRYCNSHKDLEKLFNLKDL